MGFIEGKKDERVSKMFQQFSVKEYEDRYLYYLVFQVSSLFLCIKEYGSFI